MNMFFETSNSLLMLNDKVITVTKSKTVCCQFYLFVCMLGEGDTLALCYKWPLSECFT